MPRGAHSSTGKRLTLSFTKNIKGPRALANFYGINTPTKANFKLPVGHTERRSEKRCSHKPVQVRSTIPLVLVKFQKSSIFNKNT